MIPICFILSAPVTHCIYVQAMRASNYRQKSRRINEFKEFQDYCGVKTQNTWYFFYSWIALESVIVRINEQLEALRLVVSRTRGVPTHAYRETRNFNMDLNKSFSNTTEEELLTKQDLEEFKNDLKTSMQNMKNNILEEHKITQKLLKRVLEETKSNATRKSAATKAILPKEPFKTVEHFMEFESRIQSSESKFNDLVVELQTIVCGNSIRFLKMVWRKVMSDEAARHFTWKGTSNKKSIRVLSTTGALKKAYNQKFANSSDEDFERTNMSFFHQANNRLVKKMQYSKKENATEFK
ncbi:uncharacterized protein [Eurosta solidaginis]|uniref:uncharacterized protein n=1 Tax=Eurosta solidaginis TaxID=178769 RepID=UPI0035316F94